MSKGQTWPGAMVVQSLLSIYIGRVHGGSKHLEVLHSLGKYLLSKRKYLIVLVNLIFKLTNFRPLIDRIALNSHKTKC